MGSSGARGETRVAGRVVAVGFPRRGVRPRFPTPSRRPVGGPTFLRLFPTASPSFPSGGVEGPPGRPCTIAPGGNLK